VVVVAVVRYADVAIVATWHGLWGWFWQGRGQVAAAVMVVE
jgi:hypothetical protein